MPAELALITGLAAAGGPRTDVAAAVLVFLALSYVLPIPLGGVAYVAWRRNRPGTGRLAARRGRRRLLRRRNPGVRVGAG